MKNPASQASVHYGVGLDGGLVQWVSESDTAYHSGSRDTDLSSIGIEHEDGGNYDAPRPDALYQASSLLVRDICLRYGIPITRQWILRHQEVPGVETRCPDALDVDRIVNMAQGGGQQLQQTPAPAVSPAADLPAEPGATPEGQPAAPVSGPPLEQPASTSADSGPPVAVVQSQPGTSAASQPTAPPVRSDAGAENEPPASMSHPAPGQPPSVPAASGPPASQVLPGSSIIPAATLLTQKAWGGGQGTIFGIQVFYLTVLAALAIIYFTDRSLIDLPDTIGPIPVAIPWFGALGAVLISLVGIAEHRQDWDPSYRFWHWSRPLLGASFGSISVLIFEAGILAVGSTPTASFQNVPRNLLYYLVAFVVGYREETFRELIKRITDIIFSPGPSPSGGLAVSSMSPVSGPASGGTAVTVLGMGLKSTDSVRFGTTPAQFRVDGDGQITVTAPPSQAGLIVGVTISSQSATATAGTFTYGAG